MIEYTKGKLEVTAYDGGWTGIKVEDGELLFKLSLNNEANAERLVKVWNEYDELVEALEVIVSWSKAYPIEVFPEPDLKRVAEILKVHGITLDAVSASAMRHVIESAGKIAKQALKKARIEE